MTGWNNEAASKLHAEQRAQYSRVLDSMLPTIIDLASKQALQMRMTNQTKERKGIKYDPEIPTKELIIAKIVQDFLHDVFPRMLGLSTVIDALILGLPTAQFIKKNKDDDDEPIMSHEINATARAFMRSKVGKDNTKQLSNGRVMEIVAMFVAYMFTTTTKFFEDFPSEEERDNMAMSVVYLFQETVMRSLNTFARTNDVQQAIHNFVETRDTNVKATATKFMERIHNNDDVEFYKRLLARATKMSDEFNKAKMRVAVGMTPLNVMEVMEDVHNANTSDDDSSTTKDEAAPSSTEGEGLANLDKREP